MSRQWLDAPADQAFHRDARPREPVTDNAQRAAISLYSRLMANAWVRTLAALQNLATHIGDLIQLDDDGCPFALRIFFQLCGYSPRHDLLPHRP